MAEGKPHKNQRWHDNQGELSTLIELLDSIPEEIRPLIAEALSETKDQTQGLKMGEILGSLKSLGKDKIMALHQAGKKRRSYDKDPNLHQIANTFMVMPEETRQDFAAHFLEFTSLMVDYMATCDTFGTVPKEADLQKMRDLFVDKGEGAVRAYLEEVHKPFYEMVVVEEDKQQKLVGNDDGLRIRESQ